MYKGLYESDPEQRQIHDDDNRSTKNAVNILNVNLNKNEQKSNLAWELKPKQTL